MFNPILSAYLQDIGHLQEWQEHKNLSERDELVLSNLYFVIKIAQEYRGRGLPFEDLISEGNVGLIEAARRYDRGKGIKFTTYAVWWVRQAIQEALYRQIPLIRLPNSKLRLGRTVQKAARLLSQELEREPTEEEIAATVRTPVQKIWRTNWSHTVVSLDAPVSETEDLSLHDLLPTPNQETPDTAYALKILMERIRDSLLHLSDREAQVIQLYYGLGEDEQHSLEEIGRRIGVGRERVRQIRVRALRKIQRSVIPFAERAGARA